MIVEYTFHPNYLSFIAMSHFFFTIHKFESSKKTWIHINIFFSYFFWNFTYSIVQLACQMLNLNLSPSNSRGHEMCHKYADLTNLALPIHQTLPLWCASSFLFLRTMQYTIRGFQIGDSIDTRKVLIFFVLCGMWRFIM